jgi:hypothetical protein
VRATTVLAFALAALLPGAGAPAAEGVAELEACMRANLPALSSVQTVALRHVDRTGGERTLEAEIFWKRTVEGLSRVRIQVHAPVDDRGSAYLLRENATGDPEMFVYLPEVGKPRRIHPSGASGSLFGTDFTYEDVGRMQDLGGGGGSERLPDSTLGDARVAVVAVTLAPEAASSYSRIVYQVDAERCVPLRVEFHDAGGALAKRLVADPAKITREGRGWLVRAVVLEDLQNETKTELVVREIDVEADVPDRLFSSADLARRR